MTCPGDLDERDIDRISIEYKTNLACNDPKVNDINNAILAKARESVGNWPGEVSVETVSCQSTSAKRAVSSTVTAEVSLDGENARTASVAVSSGISESATIAHPTGTSRVVSIKNTYTNSSSRAFSGGLFGLLLALIVAALL